MIPKMLFQFYAKFSFHNYRPWNNESARFFISNLHSCRDCLVTAFVNSLASLLAGFVVFAYLGYMASITGLPVEEVANEGKNLLTSKEALLTLLMVSAWLISIQAFEDVLNPFIAYCLNLDIFRLRKVSLYISTNSMFFYLKSRFKSIFTYELGQLNYPCIRVSYTHAPHRWIRSSFYAVITPVTCSLFAPIRTRLGLPSLPNCGWLIARRSFLEPRLLPPHHHARPGQLGKTPYVLPHSRVPCDARYNQVYTISSFFYKESRPKDDFQ